jgi:hypothetical protein
VARHRPRPAAHPNPRSGDHPRPVGPVMSATAASRSAERVQRVEITRALLPPIGHVRHRDAVTVRMQHRSCRSWRAFAFSPMAGRYWRDERTHLLHQASGRDPDAACQDGVST